jgi:hypothetical protein
MAIAVSLKDVVEAMDLPNNDWVSYLNRDTGEIVTVTDEDRQVVEEDEDIEHLPDWQKENLPKVREALESDRFLELPTSFDIHEWSLLERFSRDRAAATERQELLDAIHGAGAFRSFRGAIRRLGIEDEWYAFRASSLEQIAKDWLEANGIPYR